MNGRRVIISGGGTGGHLYPALAVGQKLREKDPDLHLTFVGSQRNLEKDLMDRSGFHFVALKIEGLKGRGLKSLKALALLPFAFFKSLALIVRLKPDLVIGVGGYSSGPVVLLASLLGKPTLILEQNVWPGFTTRLLLRWAKKAVAAFENSLALFKGKGVFLGNPVREEFYGIRPKPRTDEIVLLVFGGSQGSHVLNEAMTGALPFLKPEKGDLKIFHQTGKADFEWVRSSYIQNGFEEAMVSSYFFDMAGYFSKSDIIISRAGATTIAELIASQRAAILVPFARASEDHQAKNARELERIGGAQVILEKDLTPQLLAQKILFFSKNKLAISAMEENLKALKTDRPAEKIANLCFDLMKPKPGEA
jgi:UDP-N-acetylglucosamine--N-acetylmuramyl-(pentapeptide) pyrophosphoryl-undecaprenol N-acetylglucosamine transferase